MRNFTQIEEGILAGQDATIKAGNKITKEMAEVAAIRKNLFLLNTLWNHTGRLPGQRCILGREIKLGDVVLANVGEEDFDDFIFGIVIAEPDNHGDNCRILACEARREGRDPDDPYNDCVTYYLSTKNIFVLGRKKNAKSLLQILENTI